MLKNSKKNLMKNFLSSVFYNFCSSVHQYHNQQVQQFKIVGKKTKFWNFSSELHRNPPNQNYVHYHQKFVNFFYWICLDLSFFSPFDPPIIHAYPLAIDLIAETINKDN